MKRAIQTTDVLHKEFPAVVGNDGRVTVSTPSLDRHGDRVLGQGLDVSAYLNNPVLLWGHNSQEPYAVIGQAQGVEVDASGMSLLPVWREAANDADPMNIVRLLWDSGMVRAFSIGFLPKSWEENEEGGFDFTRAEILEVSLVPVPANAEALRAAALGLGGGRSDGTPTGWQAQPLLGPRTPQGATLSSDDRGSLLWDNVLGTDTLGLGPYSEAFGPSSTTEGQPTISVPPKSGATRHSETLSVIIGEKDQREAGGEHGDSLRAWIRRLVVDTNTGRQALFACFSLSRVDIPEDATALDCDDEGELVEVPHPDAGQTVEWVDCFFVPPLAYHSEKWGDDATYCVGSRSKPDDAIVAGHDDWEVVEMGEILASIKASPPTGQGASVGLSDAERRQAFLNSLLREDSLGLGGLGLCQLTRRGVTLARSLIARRTTAWAGDQGGDSTGKELDASSAEAAQRLLQALQEMTEQLRGRVAPHIGGQSDG